MDATGDRVRDENDELHEYEDDDSDDTLIAQEEDGDLEGVPGLQLGNDITAAKFRPSNPVLPDTVSILDYGPTGGRVYLVGTAHFGEKSREDVTTTIRTLTPDFVILELDQERRGILTVDEDAQQTEPTWDDLSQMTKHVGVSQGVLQFLLLKLSAHCTKKLGMIPGGEMRAAYREANRLSDCMILLGDRPISITLKRAFGALSIWQKIQFLWVVSREMGTDISQEDVEKCKSSDVLEDLIEKLSSEFPTLHRVLVHERDLFLAQVFKNAAGKMVMSTAGLQPSVSVGVVGIGHVPGIKRAWNNPLMTNAQMQDLLAIPTTSKVQVYTSRLIFLSSVVLCGFGVYKGGRFLARWIRPARLFLIPTFFGRGDLRAANLEQTAVPGSY